MDMYLSLGTCSACFGAKEPYAASEVANIVDMYLYIHIYRYVCMYLSIHIYMRKHLFGVLRHESSG